MSPIKILVADDHPMIRTAISSVVEHESNLSIVASAMNGHEAVKLFDQHMPDITLMDLNMPIMDGMEAIQTIRSKYPQAKIIILTNFDSDEDIERGLGAGAMGYLLKDASHETLIETIETVYNGQRYIPKHLMEKVQNRKHLPSLSPREMHVLELMKRGRSNRAIGVELGITESTVKSHVKNILIKMGVNDRTQAVTLALQRGILQIDD